MTPIGRVACGEYDYDGGTVALVAIAPGHVTQRRLEHWVSQALEMLANVAETQQYLAELQEDTDGRDGRIPVRPAGPGGADLRADTGG